MAHVVIIVVKGLFIHPYGRKQTWVGLYLYQYGNNIAICGFSVAEFIANPYFYFEHFIYLDIKPDIARNKKTH